MIEDYPINIDKSKRDFQVFMLHQNGDQSINGWFTYDDAVQYIKKYKSENSDTDKQVAEFEILLDNTVYQLNSI